MAIPLLTNTTTRFLEQIQSLQEQHVGLVANRTLSHNKHIVVKKSYILHNNIP